MNEQMEAYLLFNFSHLTKKSLCWAEEEGGFLSVICKIKDQLMTAYQ